MYGADYTTNAGNTTYTWSPITGQTFVNGQARYCTGLSLGLTQIGPTGNVTVALCETRSDGTPNPNRVLAQSRPVCCSTSSSSTRAQATLLR